MKFVSTALNFIVSIYKVDFKVLISGLRLKFVSDETINLFFGRVEIGEHD